MIFSMIQEAVPSDPDSIITVVNAVIAAVSAVLGFFFGKRKKQ